MSHEVFISYSSNDRNIADIVSSVLEANSISCWIAPRDIVPGKNYAKSIMDAISEAKVFLLILTKSSNASEHVLSEVERAFSKNVSIITYRIEDVLLREELEYYLSTKQWLDTLNIEVREQLRNLVSIIRFYLNIKTKADIEIPKGIGLELTVTNHSAVNLAAEKPGKESGAKRGSKKKPSSWIVPSSIAAVVVCAALIYMIIASQSQKANSPAVSSAGMVQNTVAASGNTAQAGTGAIQSASPQPTATDADATAAIAFKAVGEAVISTMDGLQYTCPANCILYRGFYELIAGFPTSPDEWGKSGDNVLGFERMKSFSVSSKVNENGYETDYTITATTLDNKTVPYVYKRGAFVFSNGSGSIEIDIGNIKKVDFDFTQKNATVFRLALVTPKEGNPFYAPIDLLMANVRSVGMGVGSTWHDGIPLVGTAISFGKIRSFEILDSENTGFNGWGDHAMVNVEMLEGDFIKGTIDVDSCDFVGISRLGVFRLSVVNKLKSIRIQE